MRFTPTLIVALLLPLAGVSAPLPPETTPATLPGSEPFVYRTVGTTEIKLHVFKPAGWQASDRRAAIIDFFGGGWTHGTPLQSAGWAKWAASLGAVGIAPDYRTKNRFGSSPLEAVSDGRAALHWVQTQCAMLGIDPARIAVGGGSAGGHLALWTAIAHTPPGSDPALAPLAPPAALFLLSAVSDTSPTKGYTPSRFGENAIALSPIDQLDPHMPPILAFHGDADKTVPQAQTLALRDKLKATGNYVEFVNVPGGAHSFTGMDGWREKSEKLVEDFLRKEKVLHGDASAPIAKQDDGRFLKLHESFLERAKQGPIDLLFLGDSITENWTKAPELWTSRYGKYHPANFGIGGDMTQNVVWRIDHGELDNIHPKVVVLMLGTNNSASNSADEIVAADTKIIHLIESKIPETKILLLAVFPRGPRKNKDGSWDDGVARMNVIRQVNAQLAQLDDGQRVRFLDLGPKFIGADGKIPDSVMPEQLHPNAAGYQIWADGMQPLLSSMLQ